VSVSSSYHHWLWLLIAHCFFLGVYSNTAAAKGFVSFLKFGLKNPTTIRKTPTKTKISAPGKLFSQTLIFVVLILIPAGFFFPNY